MRKTNSDGTLKGYEFSEGYDPEAPPSYIHIPEGEDLIDFPISPDFVRHFAYQGLTRDYTSSFYLDKKSLQPNEYNNNLYYNNRGDTTNFTGRYVELPLLGKTERRLKEIETKLNKHLGKTKSRLEDGF